MTRGANTDSLRSSMRWKCLTEHWRFAFRLLFGRFVLNDIPVFHQNPVLNEENVGRDPVCRCSKSRETTMDDHEVSICDHHAGFVSQRRGK